jgi:hypothetical protein
MPGKAMVRVVPTPEHVPQSALGGAGVFSDFVGGAFGYVRKHLILLSSVEVELRNGILLHSVAVPARGWVHDIDGESKSTGGVDLPPIGSMVFVLFPYGIKNTTGAMVLFSVFDWQNKKHQEFLKEGEESKIVEVLDGGIKITYDRADPTYTVEDVDDAKFKIFVDKKNKVVTYSDWNDNKITANSDGMVLEGKSNTVKLESGKVTINNNLEVAQ